MAETGARSGCDDTCGCPVPCPGGETCRCSGRSRTGPASGQPAPHHGEGGHHSLCSCGDHCSCNPCSCGKSSAASGTGRASCSCGGGCHCSTCSS